MKKHVKFRNKLYTAGINAITPKPNNFYFSFIEEEGIKASFFSYMRESYLSEPPSNLIEEFTEIDDEYQIINSFDQYETFSVKDNSITYYNAISISDTLKKL